MWHFVPAPYDNTFEKGGYRMKYALLVFSLMLNSFLGATGSGLSMQALIVHDDPPDQMKGSYLQDATRVESMLRQIAKACRLKLRLQKLSAQAMSQGSINSWIQQQNATKSILFFYYSGRGLLAAKASTVKSKKGTHIRPKNVDPVFTEEEIVRSIMTRGARLSIVLFDRYNRLTHVPTNASDLDDVVYNLTKKINRYSLQHIRNLFLRSKGVVTANSACDPDAATGFKEAKPHGGLFTTKLLAALREAKKHTTWDEVMGQVSHYCRYNRYKPQQPIIEIKVCKTHAFRQKKSVTEATAHKAEVVS